MREILNIGNIIIRNPGQRYLIDKKLAFFYKRKEEIERSFKLLEFYFVALLIHFFIAIADNTTSTCGGDRTRPNFMLQALCSKLYAQFFELFLGNFTRRSHHHVSAFTGLGKSNHFTNIRFIFKNHDNTVNPRSKAAVWRRTKFKSFEHVTKFFLLFLNRNPKIFKNFFLHVSFMNTNRAGT